MKVLCPKCKGMVDLHYLEREGGQQTSCPKCKVQITAAYQNSADRETWDIDFERSNSKPPVEKKKKKGWLHYLAYLAIPLLLFIIFLVLKP